MILIRIIIIFGCKPHALVAALLPTNAPTGGRHAIGPGTNRKR
jgi:hypothetical protein